MKRFASCLALFVLLAVVPALAYDGPVEKKAFAMPSYTTVGGQTIKNVRVGYETYGTLNAAHDNVILLTHGFSGNSHHAGKYKPTDAAAGYWDAIIGSGRPVDTGRFFVIATDTLVNLGVKDPNVITTGPASINPDTGKPWGMSFPIVTIRDFVNVLKDVKAKVLLLPAESDVVLFPAYSKRAFDVLKAQGKSVLYHEIPGDGGHLDGAFGIAKVGEVVRKLLAE
jgi:homoserine acetyltransferase